MADRLALIKRSLPKVCHVIRHHVKAIMISLKHAAIILARMERSGSGPHLQKGQVELLAAQLHAGPHGRLAPPREAHQRVCIAAGGAHVCVAPGRAVERVGLLVAVVHHILGGHGCRCGPLHGRKGNLLLLELLVLLPAARRLGCRPLHTPATQQLR